MLQAEKGAIESPFLSLYLQILHLMNFVSCYVSISYVLPLHLHFEIKVFFRVVIVSDKLNKGGLAG